MRTVFHSLAFALVLSLAAGGAAPAARSDEVAGPLTAAAMKFLQTLDDGQRAKARHAFDSEERFNWYYIPKDREGLPLKLMNPAQQQLALAVVKAGLSEAGYTKAETIRALDTVLAEMEKDPVRRDIEKYYLTFFGTPAPGGSWGMRWEGHHLSLHWTVVNGKAIATTPQFFGSNPAEVREGPKKGLRALAGEEDLGRALVTALDAPRRARAVIADAAPSDILTTNTRKAAIQAATGLPYSEMTTEQRGMLLALLNEYAAAQPKALAVERIAKVKKAGLDKIVFAWMGGIEKGALHYYRLQGPTFLIEYDNVQNGGNHVHAVWRDFAGDFGLDLLEEHYRKSAHHRKR
jgi:hypothetical protein